MKMMTSTTTKTFEGNSNTTSIFSIEIILVEGVDKSVVKNFEDEGKGTPENMLSSIIICLGAEHSVVPPKGQLFKLHCLTRIMK